VDLHDDAGRIETDNMQQTKEQEFILLLPDTSEAYLDSLQLESVIERRNRLVHRLVHEPWFIA
jgi:hypothetical protein